MIIFFFCKTIILRTSFQLSLPLVEAKAVPCFASSDVFPESVSTLPIQRQLPARFSFDLPQLFRFSGRRSTSFPEFCTTSLGIREIAKDAKCPETKPIQTKLKIKLTRKQLRNELDKFEKVSDFLEM